ncbi:MULTISPECIES: winged helix-turn-helix domain-containing protein [Actinomadura]|jgi:DNA-binding response OmpR family regulator|uniref:Sensory transduction protein RegX3 n=1 Tax=Actinomadura montaniterrae TaxID=1803903 RepID=A0A6L3VHA4_9ACTN|nr:response regulator transcription factor [Actinomadura montaniterrae]KAB2363231.1 response regulator transcription factor [Actinomadura montaniterrae]
MRILLVDDDDRFADALTVALRRQGFEVCRAATGAAALAAPPADLVLLDLGLPDLDGIEVCRRLRAGGDVAIIAVTARGEERDRVLGLRTGADDYLVKPFGIAELAARIDAVIRRVRPAARPVVVAAGGLRVDTARHQVTAADGSPVALTRKEFELLAALARQPGLVVTRERLLIEVWNGVWPGARRTLDVHIATLRAKLGDPALIRTVHGVGYRLAVEDEPAPRAAAAPAGGAATDP